MTGSRFDWTPRRVAHLRELLAQGCGPTEIADRLSCSRNAVQAKMRREGLKMPRDKYAVRKAKFLESLSENGSVSTAANAAGVSRTMGFRLLREARDELGWQAV